MSDFDIPRSGLPVTLEPARPRPSLLRNPIRAAFVSQLLVGRQHASPIRTRRHGTNERAIGAYASGAKVAVKRMPLGYRTTILA